MHSRNPSRAGRALAAAAVAAALGAASFASPAAAQAPVPVDVVHPAAHLITANGEELYGELTIVFGEDFAEGEHDVTAGFSLDPGTGVVYWANNDPQYGGCGPDATTGLLWCEAEDADRSTTFSYMYTAEPGAAPGVHPYAITISVDGEIVMVVDEEMEVIAADNEFPYLPSDLNFNGVDPGESAPVQPEFYQAESLPEDTAAVVVSAFRADYLPQGLVAPQDDWDNCMDDHGALVCAVTDFEDAPDTAFTFTEPIRYEVLATAPGPVLVCGCSYSVFPIDAESLESWFGGVTWEGSDDVLGFQSVEPTATFYDSDFGYIDITSSENPYDLAVDGATFKGDDGDDVTVTIEVENRGPALAPTFMDGPGSYALVGDLPEGVDFVGIEAPEEGWHCEAGASDFLNSSIPAVDEDEVDFVCLFYSTNPGTVLKYKLTAEITDGKSNDKGYVQVVTLGSEDYPGGLDAKLANNTADLTVNGGGPKLPKTGPATAWFIVAAAVALLSGLILAVAARRRSA
jgi:LPXTG-motif cell wall-anchored protein